MEVLQIVPYRMNKYPFNDFSLKLLPSLYLHEHLWYIVCELGLHKTCQTAGNIKECQGKISVVNVA